MSDDLRMGDFLTHTVEASLFLDKPLDACGDITEAFCLCP